MSELREELAEQLDGLEYIETSRTLVAMIRIIPPCALGLSRDDFNLAADRVRHAIASAVDAAVAAERERLDKAWKAVDRFVSNPNNTNLEILRAEMRAAAIREGEKP